MRACASCRNNKIEYFMKFGTPVCKKCYDKNYELHFKHRCCFSHQWTYLKNEDGLYRVHMTSGKVGLYEMQIKDSINYSCTGQHDWHFTFIKYEVIK